MKISFRYRKKVGKEGDGQRGLRGFGGEWAWWSVRAECGGG